MSTYLSHVQKSHQIGNLEKAGQLAANSMA